MTRKEKEQKVLKEDGKVFEISNLMIYEACRNPNYSLVKCATNAITPTGYLVVFELQPISGIGPSFVGRWDGGSRDEGKTERQDLDIDISGVPESERRRFENQQGGYSGHHSKRLRSATGHVYEVYIRTPKEGTIFEATVTFGVLRKLGFSATMAGFQATLGKVVCPDD
jgi:hypothetical protein